MGDLRLVPRCQLLCDLTAPANVVVDSVLRTSQWNDRSGNARHPVQATLVSQGLALLRNGVNYFWFPGVVGNTISVPLAVGTYDYAVTYLDGTGDTGTVISAGTAIFGGIDAKFAGKSVRMLVVTLAGVEQARADPAEAADGATSWNASNGLVWSVQQSGGKPALIVGRSSVLLDGADDWFKTPPFPLVQPCTFYMVVRELTWVNNAFLFDGNLASLMVVFQQGTTPSLKTYAGTNGTSNTALAIKTMGIVSAGFNGAASFLRIGKGVALVADTGAQNAGGLTLGAAGGPASNWANLQVCAICIFSDATYAAQADRIVSLLQRQNKLSLAA